MEIVEVGSKPEPLNSTIDVLLNVGSRVCDRAIPSNDIETTLRGNCQRWLVKVPMAIRRAQQPTENFVAHVMFSDEISQKFLVDTGLVDDLYS